MSVVKRREQGRAVRPSATSRHPAPLPVRRGNAWWRRRSDGSWERWDEIRHRWELRTRSAPPPPPPARADGASTAVIQRRAKKPPERARSRLVRWASTGILVLTVLAWAVFLRPGFLGGPASYVIVAGESMEPVLHTGDLVVARRQGSYRPGDVVAFKVPEGEPGAGSMVIHRIVGGSGDAGWILQGDNKDEPDFWRPTDDEISGKRWLLVPRAGHVLVLLRSPLVFAVAAGVMVFLLVVMPDEQKKP